MASRPPRDPETTRLLGEMAHRRRRRFQLQTVAVAGVVLAVLGAFVAAAVVLRQEQGQAVSVGTTTQAPATTATTTAAPARTRTTPYKPPTTQAPAGASGNDRPSVPSTATTAAHTPTTARNTATGRWTVVIDPGHQARGNNALEPIGPGSTEQKPKVTSGTTGVVTGQQESAFALDVGLKLRALLEARGVTVVMTRTSQNVDLSNIQRAQIANRAHAALFIRLHADGAGDRSVHGIHTLYPASVAGWTEDIAARSKRAAALVQQGVVAAAGATDRGLDARSDMTGFNWSDVPSVLPELGFMSNPDEDRRLQTQAYRATLARGLADGVMRFLQGG